MFPVKYGQSSRGREEGGYVNIFHHLCKYLRLVFHYLSGGGHKKLNSRWCEEISTFLLFVVKDKNIIVLVAKHQVERIKRAFSGGHLRKTRLSHFI